MTTSTAQWLIHAAERARKYFENQTAGKGSLNGPYDDITIGRDLTAALNQVKAEREVTPEEFEARR